MSSTAITLPDATTAVYQAFAIPGKAGPRFARIERIEGHRLAEIYHSGEVDGLSSSLRVEDVEVCTGSAGCPAVRCKDDLAAVLAQVGLPVVVLGIDRVR